MAASVIPEFENTQSFAKSETPYDEEIYRTTSANPNYDIISTRFGTNPKCEEGWVVINRSTDPMLKQTTLVCGLRRKKPSIITSAANLVQQSVNTLNSDERSASGDTSETTNTIIGTSSLIRPIGNLRGSVPGKPWINPATWTNPPPPDADRTYKFHKNTISPIEGVGGATLDPLSQAGTDSFVGMGGDSDADEAYKYILLFIFIAIIIGGAGFAYYRYFQNSKTQENISNLNLAKS